MKSVKRKDNWVKVKNAMMDAIKERFDEEGIDITKNKGGGPFLRKLS